MLLLLSFWVKVLQPENGLLQSGLGVRAYMFILFSSISGQKLLFIVSGISVTVLLMVGPLIPTHICASVSIEKISVITASPAYFSRN